MIDGKQTNLSREKSFSKNWWLRIHCGELKLFWDSQSAVTCNLPGKYSAVIVIPPFKRYSDCVHGFWLPLFLSNMLSLEYCLQCCLLGLLISTNQSLLLILKSMLLVRLVNFDIFLFSVFFSLWEIFLDWWSLFIPKNLISCAGVSSIYIEVINKVWVQFMIKKL